MRLSLRLICLLMLLPAAFPAWGQEDLQPFVFTPQWMPQAQFAGYYVAKEKGFYAEEGLDVTIVHPSSTETASVRILNGNSDATTMQLVQALEMLDMDIPLVNILQTSMENGLVLVSRHGTEPMKMRGARVATWQVGFDQIAQCMAAEKKLEYEWIQTADLLNLYIFNAVDATLAMSYNEYYQLLQTGLVDSENHVFRFSDNGYDIQEDGIYMMREKYETDPDRAMRFARASRRGWEWAADHREETVEIVMEYVKREYAATNRVLQQLMLDEILRLQLAKDTGEQEFRLRPEMVEAASELMYKNGMIRRPVKLEELLP